MITRHAGLFVLGAALLGSCSMNGPNNYAVHEALLYGATQERIGWVYGSLDGRPQSEVKLGEQTLTLRPQVSDPLAVEGSLSVNGRATYRAPTTGGVRKISVSRDPGGTFTVQANGNVDAVYYTDGQAWFKLTERLAAGSVQRVPPQSNTALRGAGNLTPSEADALGRALSGQGLLAVAVLPGGELPDTPLAAQPQPGTYVRTGLYLQSGVTTTASAAPTSVPAVPPSNTPPTTPPLGGGAGSGSSTPGGMVTGSSVNTRELGRGSNSRYGEQDARVVLARTPAQLNELWSLANGNQLPPPSAPSVNFSQNSVVAFFLGQRPTGGYGVRVLRTSASGNTVFVTVEVNAPPPGAITTQALTSPWVALQVPGSFQRAVVQDAQGRTLAQTE